MLARDLALRLAETVAALAVALAAALALSRLADRPRRLALALALAPLGVPPPLVAETVRRLAGGLGLAPSPGLEAIAGILVATPFAIALIWTATRRIDPREVEVARDLGVSTVAMLRRIALPVLAPALALAAVAIFARLLDDVSLARSLGGDPAGEHFGEWLRHRLVAALDFPGGAAASLLAAAIGASAGALLLAAVARRFAPRAPLAPHRPIGLPAHPGWALSATAVPTALLAGLLVAAVAAGPLFADAVESERLAAGLAEIGRAGLAALLATALAAAYALACDRATAPTRRRAIGLAFVAAALPAAALALALRLLADDVGLAVGAWLAGPAAALAAVGLPAVLLLSVHAPDDVPGAVAPAMRGEAFLRRLAAILPFAVVLAYGRALAAADLGTVVGLVDRAALLRPPASAVADPAALPALVSALVTGAIGAWAVERLRRRPKP